MTNPFSNTTILNASQHLSNKSNISKVKTLSCQRQKCNTNKITLCNNKFKRAPGHNALLNFTKGYYLTKPNCYDIRNQANDITDGRYTFFDFDKIKVRDDGISKCEYIPNYEFDNCRILNGKIVPLANINPEYKTKFFKMHTKMNIRCSDCDVGYKNNQTRPIVHDVSRRIYHDHHFPTNTKDIKHRHKHEDFSSHCCGKYPNSGHDPYPHINRHATNQYYIAKKHNPIVKPLKKRFTLKPKMKPKHKNLKAPYKRKDCDGRTFDSILKCNCKKLKNCKCPK